MFIVKKKKKKKKKKVIQKKLIKDYLPTLVSICGFLQNDFEFHKVCPEKIF